MLPRPGTRRRLAPLAGLFPVLVLLPRPAPAAEPVRPPVVEYTIQAKLDAKTHVVEGRERIVWRNPSDDAVSELRFHLYLNAFKNNRSTFMRESGGQLRGDRAQAEPEDWGYVDVESLRTSAGTDLKPGARTVQPDGNDPSDETVLAVPLPSPVPPHGQISLDVEFRSKLPRVFARTGFVRDFHLAGQWFPKLGVYEPAGMRGRTAGGWNCHAFHANSEFYADFGDYDVTLDVPSEFVMGATGRQVSQERRGDRAVCRYRQENVHDFAWTADPRFMVHEYTFDPARDVPRGWAARAAAELAMPEEALRLTPIRVRILLQPDHAAALPRYMEGVRAAVSFYGLWFGAYPYETLTVVDPPEDGLGAAGMEYPTFITGWIQRWMMRWPFATSRPAEDVVLHEYGHQYFYGLIGSNEFEESWMDEGLNTDAEDRAMELAFGPRNFIQLSGGPGISVGGLGHSFYARTPNLDPIRRRAWEFATGQSYGVNSYMKVGLFMDQLRSDLGAPAVDRAERAFFRTWAFRHPSTDDFFRSLEASLGRSLAPWKAALVEGTARLDWQVVSAKNERRSPDQGIFEREGKRVTLAREERRAAERAESRGKRRWVSTVLFGNTGDWLHGAQARIAFEDGTVVERSLPPAKWVRVTIDSSSRLAWAAVDPDRRNAWDADRSNDSIVLGTGRGAADTRGRAATAKYFGWAAAAVGLVTQLLWALA